MKNNHDKFDSKIKAVKEELLVIIENIKRSCKELPEEKENLLFKFKLTLDEMDRYSKEKWLALNSELKEIVSTSADQLHKQKLYLNEWIDKTKEDFSDPQVSDSAPEVIDGIDEIEEIRLHIENSFETISENGELTSSKLFLMTDEEKEQFALIIEALRRIDADFDNKLRKYLFTVSSLESLKQ